MRGKRHHSSLGHGRSKSLASGFLCGLLGMMLVPGCNTPPCVPGVEAGGRYAVDIIERYDEQSQFTYTSEFVWKPGWATQPCSGADGIRPGASLVLKGTGVHERRQGSCNSVTADLSPVPPEMTILGPASYLGVTAQFTASASVVFSMNDISFGECAGSFGLAVLPGAGSRPEDIFLEPVSGAYPHAVLFRLFSPQDPTDRTCPACYDNFVIHFSRL